MDFATLLSPLVNSTTRLAILPCADATKYGGRCLDAEPSKFDMIAIRSSHFHGGRNASHSLRAASRRLCRAASRRGARRGRRCAAACTPRCVAAVLLRLGLGGGQWKTANLSCALLSVPNGA